MDYLELLILVLSFVTLLAMGVPVAWSIGISTCLTILVSIPFLPATTTVAQRSKGPRKPQKCSGKGSEKSTME